MRLVLFAAFAGLLALHVNATAQEAETPATSEQQPDERASSEEPAAGEGALNPRLRKRTRQQWDPDAYDLRLDTSGLSVSPPPVPRHKTDARLRRHREGLIVSSIFVGIGGALIGSGVVLLRKWQREESADPSFELLPPGGTFALFALGSVAALGGLIGVAISGSKLGDRKRQLRELEAAHRGKRSRVQWDLARSRLVF